MSTGSDISPASGDPIARSLEAWVETEFRPWQGHILDCGAVEERLREEARRNGQVCLFRIHDGQVGFAPFTLMHRPYLTDPGHSGGARAHLYLKHLREVMKSFTLRGSALIGIFVADLHLARPQAPVFAYQKPVGNRCLLLPDVDLLRMDGHFEEDRIPFAAKRPHAIFAGSTTGTEVLTTEDVRHGTNARLNAALYFRDREDVVFKLPNIVQCDGPATVAAIEALGVGGRRWSWGEQQAFRYLVSMDGNGATCSRVAAALHGNQVLAKYASPHRLYYFHGLVPWRHYVPIHEHGDVLDLVADATAAFALHQAIAEESRRFAQDFLGRRSMLAYSALLLSTYLSRFGEGGTRLSGDSVLAVD